jgi:hypothetical protein
MSKGTLSPDGKFLWTGEEWIPAPPGMEDAGISVDATTTPSEEMPTPSLVFSSADNAPVESGVDCPYCKQKISDEQSRCHHCGGTLLFCKSKFLSPGCEEYVGVTEEKKWGGLALHAKTLGWKHYKACMKCGKEIK